MYPYVTITYKHSLYLIKSINYDLFIEDIDERVI